MSVESEIKNSAGNFSKLIEKEIDKSVKNFTKGDPLKSFAFGEINIKKYIDIQKY